jgi:hypothetical protein
MINAGVVKIYTLDELAADEDLKHKPVHRIDLYHSSNLYVPLEDGGSEEKIEEWVAKQREMIKLLYPDEFKGLCQSRKIADKLLVQMWTGSSTE